MRPAKALVRPSVRAGLHVFFLYKLREGTSRVLRVRPVTSFFRLFMKLAQLRVSGGPHKALKAPCLIMQ